MPDKCTCGCSVSNSGCYCCCNCGQKIYLDEGQTLPPCPRCTNQTFEKETAENKQFYDEKSHEYEQTNKRD